MVETLTSSLQQLESFAVQSKQICNIVYKNKFTLAEVQAWGQLFNYQVKLIKIQRKNHYQLITSTQTLTFATLKELVDYLIK